MGVETNAGKFKVAIDTKFNKLGVETKPGVSKVAVETRFNKLGVETKLIRFAPEIKGKIEDANSCGSIKLLT